MLATFEQDDRHCLVMEYVPGGTLRDLLDKEGALPLKRVLAIALELADALTRAHHLGIIHRDLKPENVLLAEDGTPRLTDFGVARLEGEEVRLTRTGSLVGSPAYMSPEALRGEELDARSDIWSFGVLLYEMLTGKRPFKGEQITQVLISILQDPVPSLADFRPEVPQALVALIEQMLVKERKARLASMRQVAAQLEAIRAGRAIEGLMLLPPAAGTVGAPRIPLARTAASTPTALPGPLPSPRLDESSGLPTPVGMQSVRTVGREAELQQLHGLLERALGGMRQVVFVTGEAGLGKTTLVNTFLTEARNKAPLWIGYGQCVEHQGAGEAYMPVLETLGRLSRGSGGDGLVALLAARAPTWLVQMPWLVSAEEFEALQRKVVAANRERMLREMVEVIETVAAERPLLLVLEDLHWSDYSTLDLLSWLARRHEPARLLLLGTYRPSTVQLHDHPLRAVVRDLQIRGQCTEVALPFLSAEAVEAYLTLHFPSLDHPDELAELLHQRTDGNPLFMRSVVDAWVAQGALTRAKGRWALQVPLEELGQEVPESLRRLIEQQLLALPDEEQAILEAASVAGIAMGFSAAAVAAGVPYPEEEVETRCAVLARRGQFLRERGTAEWADGTVATRFEFVHHLYQEVLYERIPAGRCVRLHRQIGMRLEQGYGGRAREKAAALAVHFVRGRDHPRAVQYLQVAAEHALQRSAHREALEHITKALDILRDHPEIPDAMKYEAALQAALAPTLIATKGWSAPEVEQAYARARDLSQQLGNTQQLCSILVGLATLHEVRGEYTKSRPLLEECLQLRHDGGNEEVVLESHELLACTTFHQGAFSHALEHAEDGLTVYEPQRHTMLASSGKNSGVACHAWLALSQWFLGYPDEALKSVEQAFHLAQDHSYSLASAQAYAAWLHQCRREEQQVRQRAEEAIALASEQGFPYYSAMGTILRGWTLTRQGKGEEGIEQMLKALATCRAMGAEMDRPYFLALLAEAHSLNREAEKGLPVLTEALAMVRNSRAFFYEAELFRLRATLLLQINAQNNMEEAEASFQQALEVARRQEARMLELRTLVSLGRLYHTQGMQSKVAETRATLAELCSWFTEGFDTADLREAKALLEELSDAGT
ncbi:MAG: protein kinase, partial [Chloroflexota bacterium]|nr:protein kinase [Chloroflexota bacterium]